MVGRLAAYRPDDLPKARCIMTPSRDISGLLDIMAALRTPGSGCPWDLEQTFATIAPYTGLRPSVPTPWRERNDRVAPAPKSDQ